MKEDLRAQLRTIEIAVQKKRCRLSQWETSFITNVKFQMGRGGKLASGQDEIVERIWKRARRRAV